jgi:hypothetical protein
MWWTKTKPETDTEPATKAITVALLPDPPQEEWIEVEGYKGTNGDLTAYGGFQYEVGKTYCMNGDDVSLCSNGFHFCLTQKDVYDYYPPDFNTRYFKVKGIVKKEDFDAYGSGYYFGFQYDKRNKIVAKQITLVEEIPMSEMDGAQAWFKEKYPFVKEMNSVPETEKEYKAKVREVCDRDLSESYSESFRFLMLGKDYSYQTYSKMKALADEGISPDMRAYLLLMSKE